MIPGTNSFPVLPFVGWAQLVSDHNWLMYEVQSGQKIEKDFCFVWVNSILLTTNTFPISSQSAQMKWVNLGVSGCRPLFSMRDIRTAEYFIGHVSAENTIAAASNNKCVAWRELKKKS